MFDPNVLYEPVRAPWTPPCGDGGPYAVERPTPKNPRRLQALTCTRPRGHDGDHQYAELGKGIITTWSRDGKPVAPLPTNERGSNGPANTV